MDANQSGSLYTADLSAALAAVDTSHSGSSTPTNNVAEGKMWFDTSGSPTILKIYANGGWRTVIKFDTTNVDLDARNGAFSGTVTADDVNITSDVRLKTDFHDIDDPMGKINLMKGHYYTKGGKQEVGVVAQEIQGVIPEVVDDSGDAGRPIDRPLLG